MVVIDPFFAEVHQGSDDRNVYLSAFKLSILY